MAALQQILLAIGQSLGTISLNNIPFFTSATAFSSEGNTAGADLSLTVFNNGATNVREVSRGTLSGDVDRILDPGATWLINGTASSYSVKVTRTGGTDLDFFRSTGQSDLIGAWLEMDRSQRSWLFRIEAPPNLGTKSIEFTLEIALTSNLSNVLASRSFTFVCDVYVGLQP
jgi:hypothetical protein